MQYTPPVFRPPFEESSLLLQAAIGCSHNKCSFCSMYRGVKFQAESLSQIETDLQEVRAKNHIWYKRIFLLGGDAFVLSAERLKAIALKCSEYLPRLENISMYASIMNIKNKSDHELRELVSVKINDLNIGFETALDDMLEYFNKGFTLDEARTQLLRLKEAGINFSLNIIIGAAGSKRYIENARANINFLNEIQPPFIFAGTMHIEKNTPLYDDVLAGNFTECTVGENISEEIELLRGLEMQNTYFYGRHVSNTIPVWGNLPEDKEKMLAYIDEELKFIPEEYLHTRPLKGSEGAH